MDGANVHDEGIEVTKCLLRRVREGDRQALNDLYARYGSRLLTAVRLRLGGRLRSRLESVDVVQDALIASLGQIQDGQFASEGALLHWLTVLVERRICDLADYHGAQRRDAARETPLVANRPTTDSLYGPIADVATFGTPSQAAIRQEDLARLEQAVDGLPAEQKEALLLVRYEGLALAEAAELMGRSPDAVRMLVARAIVRLGKELGGAGT